MHANSQGPEALPEKGSGLLTILQAATAPSPTTKPVRRRVQLPLIRCKPGSVINPTREELDASLWGERSALQEV